MSGSNDGRRGNGDSPLHQLPLLIDEPRGPAENGDSPHFRISNKARRISIRVFPDARVEVVVPPRARPRDIESFVTAQREWIDSKRALALRNKQAPEPFPPAQIGFLMTAERWRLHLAAGAGRVRIKERGNAADASRVLDIAGSVEGRALRGSLRAWLKRMAAARLEPRVAALAAATGVKFSRVAIRRQRSRWGSCSVRGTISLNLCLLFQRPEVVDYLIIHELMHVRHMNHSARFWAAVEKHCANWRALDRELLAGWRSVPRWVYSDA
jgi:predicted metal-dependent hydrolase